jgi:DNA-binding response OmpR family regulator
MENQTTILIVDDEEAGRQALEGVLFSQGFHLVFAENGAEAIQKAREWMPDLILLDVMMPQMDGMEVCRTMRADSVLAEIPILLVTALDDRVSRIKGIEAGADDFITKPFDRIELRARVKTITRLNRYRRLLLERARFVWVTEQSREGYVILNARDEIKYANPAARVFLNASSEEAIGQPFLPWVQKQYNCEPEQAWAEWKKADALSAPLFLIRRGEESGPVWLQIEMLNLPTGSGSNRLLRITEVTEKLSLYQEVWTFQKMVTHKLRTPLSNMVMAAELFRRQAVAKAPEEVLDLADMISAAAKRIRGEVEDVLSYLNMPAVARSGSGLRLSDLDGLVFRIGADLGIEKVSLLVAQELPQDLTLRLSIRSMEVILLEVLENARKFHPQGSPTLEVRAQPYEPDSVLLVIKDDGVSLAPEQLRRMWMPYYQAEGEFTGEIEGMGLGLSTVAKLIWETGGKCRSFNRADGPGVVIELVLPKQ